jgi:hypothetical protein
MPVDDRTRLQLHHRLEEVLGAAEADTLMEHLPPVGWRDVATKQDIAVVTADIAALEVRVGARFDVADARLDSTAQALRAEIATGFGRQAWFLIALTTAQTGVLGLALALAG